MLPPISAPPATAYRPPTTTGTGAGGVPAPGKLWPPDRKVWTNGLVSGVVFTALSYLHYWTGVDLNIFNPIVGIIAPGTDVTALLSILIGSALAQYLPPSVHDGVAWLNDRVIRAANASPDSPVRAMPVDDHTSEVAARRDIAAGVIPDDIVAKREGEGP